MKPKTVIYVEDVISNANERAGFNAPALMDIVFHYDGRVITVPEEELSEWRFSGLSNADCIVNREWPDNPIYKCRG